MRYSLFVLAALLGLTGTTQAQDAFIPAVTYPAAHASIEGRAIDILALQPGMTAEETRSALAEHYAPETIVEHPTVLQVSARGVTIRTSEFPETVSAGHDDDQITISFTGPASDNQVFAIERKVRHNDVLSASTIDDIVAALIAKYGTPSMNSADGYQTGPNNPGRLVWAYLGGRQVPCSFLMVGKGPACTLLFSGYAPDMLEQIARETLDFDYVIRADIWPHDDDVGKTRQFTLRVLDFGRRHQAAQADTQALLSELERVHAEASHPVAAPAL